MTDAITAESAHQATSKRKPPEVDVEVLEIENLPDHSEPWEKIQRYFLPVHFLLLTVKDCEFLSCLSFLQEGFVKSNRKPLGIVYFGNIRDNKHEEVKVAVMKCNMGSSTTGGSLVVVPNAVRILRPKAVFSVGFCASLNEKKAELGDVVVCSKLITYASIKQEGDMVEERGVKVPLNRDLATLARHIGDGWKPPVKYSTGQKVKPRRGGVFLSGPEVINDRKRRDALIKRYPEATAIEMEGEGLFVAAHDLDVEWIVIKGVSDFADGKKSETDLWRPFASVMAASLVSHTLKDSRVFEFWPHFEDNSDVEDGSPRKRPQSSSPPSGSDPKRNKATAGESYAEDAQPRPSNQVEPRSIRPGDKAPTTYKVKNGTPSDEELYAISENIAEGWKLLGRRLNITEPQLVKFHKTHEEYTEKPYQMLLYWKKREGEKQPTKATYLVLHDALCHPFVARKDLAEKICCPLQN